MIARTCANCGTVITDATATMCPLCGVALTGAIPSIYPPLSDLVPPPPPGGADPPPTPVPGRDPQLPATLIPPVDPLPPTLLKEKPTLPPPPAVEQPPPVLPPPIVALPAVPKAPSPPPGPIRTAGPVASHRAASAPSELPLPASPANIPPALQPSPKGVPVAHGAGVRPLLVTLGMLIVLIGSAFGLWNWLFATQQPPYGDAMQALLDSIFRSRSVWNLPAGALPDDWAARTYALLGLWLTIIPAACAGAFWLTLRERQRGHQQGAWGDSFVLNLVIFVLGTVFLSVEKVAAPLLSGITDQFHHDFLWAPKVLVAMPYALVFLLLVLALMCSSVGALLAGRFARWQALSSPSKASYGMIFLVALVCVLALVAQAAIFQTLFDGYLRMAPMTVIWYPVAAVAIVVLAAAFTRGPTP